MEGRPYPFERLARVTRMEAAQLRTLVRALPDAGDPRIVSEATALLGAPLTVRAGAPELISGHALRATLPEALCAIALEQTGEAQPWPLWLELPLEAAAVLVDRVLGGDGRALPGVARPLDELSTGVLGYLAARLCAASGSRLRVRAIASSRDAVLGSAAPALRGGAASPLGERMLVWPLTLGMAGAPLAVARALIPEPTASALSRLRAPHGLNTFATLADLPVPLCAHAGRATLRRSELDALEPGDAVIPDRCQLVRGLDGRYGGMLELHAAGSRTGFSCRLEGSALTLGHATYPGESTMTDTKSIATAPGPSLAELAADTPIELCLELARFHLPLRELAALRPGEVLSAGSAIGALVTLTAAGKPLARGELVDLDGEVGVRITELVR